MSTNYIDQITDTNNTTHDISEGDSTRIFRATCATAATTAAKVATLQTSDRNFSLTAGVRVAVTFTYGNTSESQLTLNVNNTGAKVIHVRTSATSSYQYGSNYNTWGNYETVIFTYNGSIWINGGSGLMIYNAWNLANSKTANTGTITSVTTTAGAHSTISVSSGAVSFNVPTKTSHLTNDSGFITSDSDEKVKVTQYSQSTTYYPILATGVGTATRQIATNGISFRESGGGVTLDLGLDSNHWGILSLGGESQYKTTISGLDITANRSLTLPDKSGTIALTSDITGGNYTATSPINITNDVISHAASGVTAGTYSAAAESKTNGYYIPSFTVDNTGHITSVSSVGTLISQASQSANGFMSTAQWNRLNEMSTKFTYLVTLTITAGQTSTTSQNLRGYQYYKNVNNVPSYSSWLKICAVFARDSSTGEEVMVDVSSNEQVFDDDTGFYYSTITASIASAYTNNIEVRVLAQGYYPTM